MNKVLLACILSFSVLYADNNIIMLGGDEYSGTIEMQIKGNGEECKVSMDITGAITNTTCLQLINSKKVA